MEFIFRVHKDRLKGVGSSDAEELYFIYFNTSHQRLTLSMGLILSHNTSNNPMLVIQFSCSSSFRFCMNPIPSQLSHISITGIPSLSCVLQLLFMKMFSTSTSNLHSSCYLLLSSQTLDVVALGHVI